MYKEVVKPLIKQAKADDIKIIGLTKELKKTIKHLKVLNASVRHPVVAEKISRACHNALQKESVQNIDQLAVQKLRKAGLYGGSKETVDKFAKVLNSYFVKPQPKEATTDGSLERTLSNQSYQDLEKLTKTQLLVVPKESINFNSNSDTESQNDNKKP